MKYISCDIPNHMRTRLFGLDYHKGMPGSLNPLPSEFLLPSKGAEAQRCGGGGGGQESIHPLCICTTL